MFEQIIGWFLIVFGASIIITTFQIHNRKVIEEIKRQRKNDFSKWEDKMDVLFPERERIISK